MTPTAEQRNAARKVIEMARRLGYRAVRIRRSSDGKLRIRLAQGSPARDHQRHRRK